MKVKVNFSLARHSDVLDLVDCGYDDSVKWSDLTEDQKHEITDILLDELTIYTDVEEL